MATDDRLILSSSRLYAVTPDDDPARLEALLRNWLGAGVQLVQLRHKSLDRRRLFELATRLQAACAAAGALLVVNDHLDIAMAVGAGGVHLGQEDLRVATARAIAPPGMIIGASVQTLAEARQAIAQGADYLGAGPTFGTPIKPEKPVIGPLGVAAIAATVEVPVFAIGGIDEQNLGLVREAGLDRICVIRAISSGPDPGAQVAGLLRTLHAPR
ncbi:MAG TPA: thiamine phosphate synthase [Candidatus Acidoferrales bacterium]|nr:thiamine phosphate synthase [Candidatus Acidoferrales bacterium]